MTPSLSFSMFWRDQTLLIFTITCTLRRRRVYDEQKIVVAVSASLPELPIKREMLQDVKVSQRLNNLFSSAAYNRINTVIKNNYYE